MFVLLECVVETADAAVAAERAGANRLELCVHLHAGGVTPPAALIATVLERVAVPVCVMIRPRAGDFVYGDDEFAAMVRAANDVRALGANGIVTGLLNVQACVDLDRTRRMVEAAGSVPVTFHRAFDAVADHTRALEDLITAGVTRVLTSGGAPSAIQGVDRLAALVRQAGDRITVLAGGGVRADNVRELIARSGVHEVHARFEDDAATRALAALL